MRLASLLAACALGLPLQAAEFSLPPPPRAVADCVTCHGVAGRGNPAVGAPPLAGLPAWYTAHQLRAFRDGWRGTADDDVPGWEMQAVAVSLDAAELRQATDWFAAMEKPLSGPETIEGDTARGEMLYAACAECHGGSGEGRRELGAPPLAGRPGWYLLRQLTNYRAGRRGFHPDDERGQRMAASARQLPDDGAVRDVVTYIEQLK